MFEDGVPWRDGLKTGVGVWCLGFGIVALLLTILSVLAGQFDPIGILASAIVFFLASHGWPLLLSPGIVDLTPVFFLPAPAMLLFYGGFRIASAYGTDWSRDAYLASTTVILGYAPMTIVSLLLFLFLTGGVRLSAIHVIIVGVTGFILPLLAAGLGGILASR
jgi:hypothetical protein